MDDAFSKFFRFLEYVFLEHLLYWAYRLIKFAWDHPFLTIFLVLLWLAGKEIHARWNDERIYRQYLERIRPPSTMPQERERQIEKAASSAIASIPAYRPAKRRQPHVFRRVPH